MASDSKTVEMVAMTDRSLFWRAGYFDYHLFNRWYDYRVCMTRMPFLDCLRVKLRG